mmetsp:Transcript_24943/g.58109  ORF Transcript_24943/g.58109 Transcript_24943/m.58109 type:complete len:200 (+) Transcript_24943:1815-2414(+)
MPLPRGSGGWRRELDTKAIHVDRWMPKKKRPKSTRARCWSAMRSAQRRAIIQSAAVAIPDASAVIKFGYTTASIRAITSSTPKKATKGAQVARNAMEVYWASSVASVKVSDHGCTCTAGTAAVSATARGWTCTVGTAAAWGGGIAKSLHSRKERRLRRSIKNPTASPSSKAPHKHSDSAGWPSSEPVGSAAAPRAVIAM